MRASSATMAALTLLAALVGAGPARAAGPDWEAAGWHGDWAAARAEARSSGRPLFLYFDAAWCSWCRRYERETLSRPRVQRILRRETVPVRLDWDARSDLVSRYGGRGLPFNVLLAPDGAVLRTFTGILAPEDLFALVRRIPAEGRAVDRPGRRPDPSLDRAAYRDFRQAFLDHLERLYDPALGTLAGRYATGRGLKRAQPRTWLWLMERPDWRERAARAARRERERLLDAVDGGFFYYVDPHRDAAHRETAKLAEHNAWMAAWLARAGTQFGEGESRWAALSGWFFLAEILRDRATGGFWRAQVADGAYYALEPARRLEEAAPPVDRILRSDVNAEVAQALLRVAESLGRPAAAAQGTAALDFVLRAMLRGDRLHHSRRDGQWGPSNLPGDLLRVLVAGHAVQRREADAGRGRRLAVVAERAAAWLRRAMAEDTVPRPELAALAARACGLRERYPALPDGCQEWALRRLALRPETRPDWLIPGLRAWEARLAESP